MSQVRAICKTTVGICKAEDSMNICHSKERWKKILLKWMEGQDAAEKDS